MNVNDEYKIEDKESLNYIELLCYIYKKYGLFVTLYTINNEKLKILKEEIGNAQNELENVINKTITF